jgi:hypothetical protein
MWPHSVVIHAPRFNHRLRFSDADKPVLIEALVPKLPLKLSTYAFSIGLPGRMKWSSIRCVSAHVSSVRPANSGPLIHQDHTGQARGGLESLEDADHTCPWQRAIDFNRDALPSEVVHDVQRPKRAAIGQCVGRDVHRPAFAAGARCGQRHALSSRDPFASTPSDLQPGLAIHPMDTLVIRDHPFTGDQGVQPTVTVAGPHGGVRLEPRQQLAVVHTVVSLIAPGRRTETDDPTGSAYTAGLRVHEPPHRHALRAGAYHFFATTAFNA